MDALGGRLNAHRSFLMIDGITHRLAIELEAVGVVDDAVEGEAGKLEHFPFSLVHILSLRNS